MHAVVMKHSRVLLRKRRQGTFRDEYGILNDQKWQRDLQHFVKKVLALELDQEDLSEVFDLPTAIEEILDAIGSEADDSEELALRFKSPQSLGFEFEHSCAQVLRSLGWEARVTTASGDQGVDIEAERNGYTVVVQCKLYASPVGNGAVQEIAAGRLHYGADCGVVISKSSFTPAARQLAKTTGVVLLDYDDLTMIDTLLFDGSSAGPTGAELQLDQLSGDRSNAGVLSLAETDVAMQSRSQDSGLGGRFKRARPMKEIRIEPVIGRDAD
ncbi:Restriction endonuclease [compost metagenome]